MAGKVRTWVWVVVAVVVIGILGIVAMAGLGLYFFSRHVSMGTASPAGAEREFEEVRERFKGQQPLIELDERGRFLRANTDRTAPADAARPTTLHLLAFDAGDGRIVRMSLPFWVLRMRIGGTTTFSMDGTQIDLEELRLTVDDLERYGPALIVDHRPPGRDHVLLWSQ